jgi:Pyridoxamine 5'-phosphate oxidase
MADGRMMEALSRDESLRLLASIPIGRVIFTQLALPAIRLVYHLVENDQIVIRAHLGAAITAMTGPQGGTVVAYEADMIDTRDHVGWSVIVVGRAWRLPDTGEDTRYRQALRPWATGVPDDIIAIRADVVDGHRLARIAG